MIYLFNDDQSHALYLILINNVYAMKKRIEKTVSSVYQVSVIA